MRALIVTLFVWTFFVIHAYAEFPELVIPKYIDFASSVTMLLSSLFIVSYFKSKWWSAILLISFPTFLSRLTVLLYQVSEIPYNQSYITYVCIALTLLSFTPILILKHLARWKTN